MRKLLKKEGDKDETAGDDLIPTYARLALEGVTVKDVMSIRTLTVSDQITVNDFLSEHLEKGRRFYNVIDKDEKHIGHVSVNYLKKIPRRYWDKKKIGLVMRKRKVRLLPSDDMFLAVEKMISTSVSPIPIVNSTDTSKIIGTISRSDIMRFLVKSKN